MVVIIFCIGFNGGRLVSEIWCVEFYLEFLFVYVKVGGGFLKVFFLMIGSFRIFSIFFLFLEFSEFFLDCLDIFFLFFFNLWVAMFGVW